MKNITEIVKKAERPVKVLQFGEGNFLRAFVDWIIDNLNEKTDFNGNVMMVQPLANGMGDMINAQNGLYTTCLRGIQNGKPVEQFRQITSVAGCINPYSEYDKFIAQASNPDLRFIISNTTEAGIAYREGAQASNPDLRFIISNTTEAGIAYKEGDKLEDKPQTSFPGKVCAFLYNRYKAFGGDPSKGLIMIPCELIDKNGDNLRRIVLQYAEEWNLEKEFTDWVENLSTASFRAIREPRQRQSARSSVTRTTSSTQPKSSTCGSLNATRRHMKTSFRPRRQDSMSYGLTT